MTRLSASAMMIKNIVPVDPPIEDDQLKFSFALRKGDAELLEKLNEGLALIEASKSA